MHPTPRSQTVLDNIHNRTWAILVARAILGLIFFMAGVWKVFTLGPVEHARRLFVEPYADTFLPAWSLWATGTVVPLVAFVRQSGQLDPFDSCIAGEKSLAADLQSR